MGFFARRVVSSGWSVWDRYGVAFAILATATLVEHWFMPEPHRAPFLFFYFAVVTCSLFFDLVTALSAAVLSSVILAFFFMEPLRSVMVWSGQERLSLVAFAAICVATSLMIEGLHRCLARLARGDDDL